MDNQPRSAHAVCTAAGRLSTGFFSILQILRDFTPLHGKFPLPEPPRFIYQDLIHFSRSRPKTACDFLPRSPHNPLLATYTSLTRLHTCEGGTCRAMPHSLLISLLTPKRTQNFRRLVVVVGRCAVFSIFSPSA